MAITNGNVITLSNTQLLNTIRKYAPSDFAHRTPVATQANMAASFKAIEDFPGGLEIWYNTLLNRIGRVAVNEMTMRSFLEPVKQEAMLYGKPVEEVQVNLLAESSYNPMQTNVYGRRDADLHVNYHTENRQALYDVTIPGEQTLRGAFLNGTGVSALLSSIFAAQVNSDRNGEHVAILQLLKAYKENEGYYNYHIDDPITSQNGMRDATAYLRQLNVDLKQGFTTKYSSEGRLRGLATNATSTILYISSYLDARLATNYLANIFNLPEGESLEDYRIVVPTDYWPLPKTAMVLADRRWLAAVDTLSPMTLTSPVNPYTMEVKSVLHHWQALYYSRFLPAVMVSTDPDTQVARLESRPAASVKLTDTQSATQGIASAGDIVPLTVSVVDAQGTPVDEQGVRYDLRAYTTDHKRVARLSSRTFIDSRGQLHVGAEEPGTSIHVVAVSLADETIEGTYVLTVDGAKALTAVTVDAVEMGAGSSVEVTLHYTPADATDKRIDYVRSADASIATASLTPDHTGLVVSGVASGKTQVKVKMAALAAPVSVDVTVH